MKCADCLIWIGNSYRTVDDYVKEAERRGCCRQVPYWPAWAKRGKTRVFLAHRDDHGRPDRGVILGYFNLEGVDIVLTQADCDRYKKLAAESRIASSEYDRDSLVKFWHTPAGRKKFDQLDEFWRKKLPRNRLPFKRRDKETSKQPSDRLDDDIIDFVLDFFISCKPERNGDGHVGYGISTDQTSLEESRDCPPDGLRIGPEKYIQVPAKKRRRKGGPSFYFVDALTRRIDQFFCELLKKMIKAAIDSETRKQKKRGLKNNEPSQESIRADYVARLKIQAAKKQRRRNRQDGIQEFKDAVTKASKERRGLPRISPEIKNVAERRSAMVSFDKPYPFFKGAAFRGLMRIDGDKLLRRISDTYSKNRSQAITLPRCEDPSAESGLTLVRRARRKKI